jgi:hypothetical protein
MSGDSDQWVSAGRDSSAFYQAETQMLVRENQMLRHRIRDLERQLSESSPTAQITHEPASHSHLLRTQSVDDEPMQQPIPSISEALSTPAAAAKET